MRDIVRLGNPATNRDSWILNHPAKNDLIVCLCSVGMCVWVWSDGSGQKKDQENTI